MRGRLWLKYFTEIIDQEYQKHEKKPGGEKWTDTEWTEFIGSVLDGVAEKMNCYVARRRQENKEASGEYLGIDAVFIDNAEYGILNENSKWDPFVLPRAVIELENEYRSEKISYCLWKILCIRSPVMVLICYQKSREKVDDLKKHLEDVIWQGSLMKGTDGDLLVIIGNNDASEGTWGEYFTILEWRNDGLEEIKKLEW